MLGLSAVEPKGSRCVDLDLELWDFGTLSLHHLVSVSGISSTSGAGGSGTAADGGGGCSNRFEAGPDATVRCAGLCEGGLCDRMILAVSIFPFS
jgi:hypothetical protein